MKKQRPIAESGYRRQKVLAEKRMAEKIAEYNRQRREGKKPWEIEGREVNCPLCGDGRFFWSKEKGAIPDQTKYHLVPETEQRGGRPVKTGRFLRDSDGRWLCVCDCSWDEENQRVGPQTARGLAKVKDRMMKQREITF